MKLSTATRYGLRAISDLCAHGGGKPVAVSDIARREEIPSSYLEQLFAKLRRAGLVQSIRGAQGGYVLARPGSEISIAEIVQALGEPIAFGDCQTDSGCRNAGKCSTYDLWRRVKFSVDDILSKTTLEEISGRNRVDRETFFTS